MEDHIDILTILLFINRKIIQNEIIESKEILIKLTKFVKNNTFIMNIIEDYSINIYYPIH